MEMLMRPLVPAGKLSTATGSIPESASQSTWSPEASGGAGGDYPGSVCSKVRLFLIRMKYTDLKRLERSSKSQAYLNDHCFLPLSLFRVKFSPF